MATKLETNGVLLDELRYEPIPEEPAEHLAESHSDNLPGMDEPPAPEPTPAETPKITKIEAMRQALADLGLGARNSELGDYLRAKFGIQPKNVGVLKSQAKKSLFKTHGVETNAHPAAEVPESNPREVVKAPPPTETKAPTKKAKVAPERGVNGAANGHRVVLIRHHTQPDGAVVCRQLPVTTIYSVEEVQAVKKLCERLGTATVLRLIDLLES